MTENILRHLYCFLFERIDEWFRSFMNVNEMCGNIGYQRRVIPEKGKSYQDVLIREGCAARDLPEDLTLRDTDICFATPIHKAKISCREFMNGEIVIHPLVKVNPP
jgi:hypothetical protein